MKENILTIIKIVIFLSILISRYCFHTDDTEMEITIPVTDSISEQSFLHQPAKEGLREALTYYGIYHSDIVYAQAILETGHFRSTGCIKYNNLFGLYDSKRKRYHRFNHWIESVIAYKDWVQKRYKPPEDYYKFLERINYASDPRYTDKLRIIVKKENDKRRYVGRDTLP